MGLKHGSSSLLVRVNGSYGRYRYQVSLLVGRFELVGMYEWFVGCYYNYKRASILLLVVITVINLFQSSKV